MPAVLGKRRLGEGKGEAEGGKKGILLIVDVNGIESP